MITAKAYSNQVLKVFDDDVEIGVYKWTEWGRFRGTCYMIQMNMEFVSVKELASYYGFNPKSIIEMRYKTFIEWYNDLPLFKRFVTYAILSIGSAIVTFSWVSGYTHLVEPIIGSLIGLFVAVGIWVQRYLIYKRLVSSNHESIKTRDDV